MFTTILITSNNQTQKLKAATDYAQINLSPGPDTLILEPNPSITINQIKTLEKFLHQKTYQNKFKVCLIKQAQLLTLPAQNALLKTLEEPPNNSLIILLASHLNQLLPTVVSRCHHIHLKQNLNLNSSEKLSQQKLFNSICKSPIDQRIDLACKLSISKKQALEFIVNQLYFIRHKALDTSEHEQSNPANQPLLSSEI